MRKIQIFILFAAPMMVISGAASADTNLSIAWLLTQQAFDGSWGVPALSFGDTQEAVDALHLAQKANSSNYYRGIAWLENHVPANNDAQSRKLATLSDRGDPTAAPLNDLDSSYAASTIVTGASGWGLGGSLESSPYDTALVLRALAKQNPVPVEPGAIIYLENTRLPNSGWEQVPGTGLDITTTAQVIRALIPYQSQDSSLSSILTSAANAMLAAVVTAGSNASIKEKSLALIVATTELPTAPQIALWHNDIQNKQLADGSWEDDVFSTAIAMQALASSGGGSTSDFLLVAIPDANLRAAINAALGHNAGDSITRAELATLTSLDASNRGITNLTGLEYAVNLTALNISGNAIHVLTPILGLTNLTSLNVTGNPLGSGDYDNDGIYDSTEAMYGLNPVSVDTDGDGIPDGIDPFPLIPGTPLDDNAPVAIGDNASTTSGHVLWVYPLTNDSDADSDTLSVIEVHPPLHGTSRIGSGSTTLVIYTPASGYYGSDNFTYRITDGHGGFSSATISVQVTRPNVAPVAVADSVTARNRRGGGGIVKTIKPVANDTDADGDTLTITSITQPTHGLAVLQADGVTVLYTPTSGYHGADSFTYAISDGFGGTATGTITIQVRRGSFLAKHAADTLQ